MSQLCPKCSRDNGDNALNCAHCSEALRGLLGSNTLLENRYRVSRVLGCGGMGAVYLAEDARIPGRQVAVKENLDPTALAQFQAEVGVMTQLAHPGLPTISDQFVGPTGHQYLVMDFIAGENLEELVDRRGPLPEPEVIDLVTQLLEILEYLHGNGVIHRDIKPANVKVLPGGRPVLVDFGIAKHLAPGSRTQTWARGMGSPGFAPVEQYTGGTDVRSDLYSLGAVMYYLLTGQVPPDAPRLAGGAPLTPPRQLRPGLSLQTQRIIFRAMAPAPNQRYQTAAEMRLALAPTAKPTLPPPVPGTPPAPTQSPLPRKVSPSMMLAVASACMVGVALLSYTLRARSPVSTPTPVVIVQVYTATSSATLKVDPASGWVTTPATPVPPSNTVIPVTVLPTAAPSKTPTPSPPPTRTRSPTPRPSTTTFTPTRVPPTNTPRPTPTPTPRPPQVIASNVSGFSGSQGANGWNYQVEQGRNSGNFRDFPTFAGYGSPSRNCWQTPQEGHVRICQEGEVHPGVTGRIAYRWRSDSSRSARAVVHAHKMDTRCGDGVWIGVYRVPQDKGPEKIGEFSIGGATYQDRPANVHTYSVGLGVGDSVMVMVDIRGDSGCDQTRLYIEIY